MTKPSLQQLQYVKAVLEVLLLLMLVPVVLYSITIDRHAAIALGMAAR